MSQIFTSADQLIGKTPLLELVHIEKEMKLEARILAKLEYFNPAGSVKDRIAKSLKDIPNDSGFNYRRPRTIGNRASEIVAKGHLDGCR